MNKERQAAANYVAAMSAELAHIASARSRYDGLHAGNCCGGSRKLEADPR
jgi:hypothetical protein